MNKLVRCHLPAKFALTGYISFFEMLPNGFYDYGLLLRDETFIPLHELKYEDPQFRKIIYLNFDNQFPDNVLANNVKAHLDFHFNSIADINIDYCTQVIYTCIDVFCEQPSLQTLRESTEPSMIQTYVEEIQRQVNDESSGIIAQKSLVRLIGNFVANKLGGPSVNWRVSSKSNN